MAPLPSFRLGSVQIDSPFAQAALSGYSDAAMRTIARRFGASYTLCEVMLDEFLVHLKDRRRTSHFLHIAENEHPVGGQLMGAEPEQFAEGAKRLVAAGFDVIDINFGCPVKKVLGRCRGGYHLGHPETALEIVARTRDVVPSGIPVTLKMRRGVDDTTASRDHFFQILDGAFALGIDGITVHGRTVVQGYVGSSQWDFLRDVKRHVGARSILGSGDLFTAADCVRMLEETGVDGVSIARGAIGNPWIFAESRALLAGRPLPPPPSLREQRDVIDEHYCRAIELYGERAARMMRKFGVRYAALHPQYEAVRQAFVQVKHYGELDAIWQRWYAE